MIKLSKKLIVVLGTLLILSPLSIASHFPDVPNSHPNHRAIGYLFEQGMVSGFNDGTFKPDLNIKRSEILKVSLNGAKIDCTPYTNQPSAFNDVPENHTLKMFINCASAKGFVDGYGDGNYGPENPVTQGEATKIILNINGITPTQPENEVFIDVPLSIELALYIYYVHENNLVEMIMDKGEVIQGGIIITNDFFGIDAGMTRKNVVELMYRTIVHKANNNLPYNIGMSAPNENTSNDLVKTVEVSIDNFDFVPRVVVINVGDTINWRNNDNVAHHVASDPHPVHTDLPGLDSGSLDANENYSYTFTNPGTFTYHCHVHPNMTGTIIVK